jgi:uncharacterized protein (DUF1697 family)
MKTYIALLRGINVGGKNRVPMADLRACLEKLGFKNVATYIASGNVVLDSDKSAKTVRERVEKALIDNFKLDDDLIKVLVLIPQQLQKVIDKKPKGFGEDPKKYYCDVIFLIDITADEAMPVFNPREGVDSVWPGDGVIYSQRLGAERTKSRLGKIVGTSPYKSMTIRSWNTVEKLLEIIKGK